VTEQTASMLDSTRLLLDLQRATGIAQTFSGCLQPETIACLTTDGLVHRFSCAFARIWLVEPDQSALQLVASSGLYTRTDGSFARVPMGAYKVGKIAQNRVSFLSNTLAEESWVKDREWAIANRICGFAGFPLVAGDRVIGVLAAFSHEALSPEFLEVLKVLCTVIAIALDQALAHQKTLRNMTSVSDFGSRPLPVLSDQLAPLFDPGNLTLMGTERPLTLAQTSLFLQVADRITQLESRYCRLMYTDDAVVLESLANVPSGTTAALGWAPGGLLPLWANSLGGELRYKTLAQSQVLQVVLSLPYTPPDLSTVQVQVQCRSPVFQAAFTHLAYAAGVQVNEVATAEVPLLTDDPALLPSASPVVWVQSDRAPLPAAIHACVDLSTDAAQLRSLLEALSRGQSWACPKSEESTCLLSPREQEILSLLGEGLRDRDIAQRLIISESTVKFHINNVLTKLKAKTRFQALYQVIKRGWI
jgi:DNA-binding CsgD family transcriptional regulator